MWPSGLMDPSSVLTSVTAESSTTTQSAPRDQDAIAGPWESSYVGVTSPAEAHDGGAT